MAEQTKPRPIWAMHGLETLNERLESALRRRAAYEQSGIAVQIHMDELTGDIDDYCKQIAEWKARYGIEEATP